MHTRGTGRLQRLIVTVREHLSNAVIGGLILITTGFTPEHWIAHVLHAVHLPENFFQSVFLGIDPRLMVVTLGMAIIVTAQLFRRRSHDNELRSAGANAVGTAVHAPSMAPSTLAAVSERPSIAVLPFDDMSGQPDQDYFANGMVEDIITGLSRIKWLLVIARNSSFTYKGRTVDVKQIGRELGVRYVLEGSVRKASDRMRISAQLVEAETGVHIWADRYDRPLIDIFALQDEITLSVIGAIEPNLREAEAQRVKRKRPESLDAYDLVLRAVPHGYVAMPEDAIEAIPILEKALAIEPDYARAHGYLGWAHEILFVRSGFKEQNRSAAIRHAHAAITHGHDDATPLAIGAFVVALMEHDRKTAFEAFERALTISPSSSFTLFLGSVALAWGAEADRAIDWATRALRVSPLDRLIFMPYHALAAAHFLNGNYPDAANYAARAIQSNPTFSVSRSLLVAPLVKLGRVEEAKAAAQKLLELQPAFSARGFCAAISVPAVLAGPLTQAWREAGLPP